VVTRAADVHNRDPRATCWDTATEPLVVPSSVLHSRCWFNVGAPASNVNKCLLRLILIRVQLFDELLFIAQLAITLWSESNRLFKVRHKQRWPRISNSGGYFFHA
jgi:hypothetical protein